MTLTLALYIVAGCIVLVAISDLMSYRRAFAVCIAVACCMVIAGRLVAG